jgi:hypothetical protein
VREARGVRRGEEWSGVGWGGVGWGVRRGHREGRCSGPVLVVDDLARLRRARESPQHSAPPAAHLLGGGRRAGLAAAVGLSPEISLLLERCVPYPGLPAYRGDSLAGGGLLGHCFQLFSAHIILSIVCRFTGRTTPRSKQA